MEANFFEKIPSEISKVNVIVGRPPAKLLKPFYNVDQVNKENNRGNMEEIFKTIVRRPIVKVGREGCPEIVTDGKGTWIAIAKFRKQPSYEACLNVCNRERFSDKYCPCSRLFNHNKKGE